MSSELFRYIFSFLLVSLGVIGTTILGSSGSNNQVWADVIEGTEGPDDIVGTPGDDQIDSKGGDDDNWGDSIFRDGSGNDVIDSGEGNDANYGDSTFSDGSGNDIILSGGGIDTNYGDTFEGDGSGDDTIVSGEGMIAITETLMLLLLLRRDQILHLLKVLAMTI
jgi:RTX calcium-binding nonapeptide repeat (4 copies)